ncbi:hypothetical protein [Novosphingobium sp.]|uniref:hypothetical protein n=1 Tax=Novosphingobium sp. TaxID=1874826 RepID=UPI0028A92E8F|nr:hypothetical protein [Novosphingobium sp.]
MRVKLPPMSAVFLLMGALAPIIPAVMIAGPVLAQPEPAALSVPPSAPIESLQALEMQKVARAHFAQLD